MRRLILILGLALAFAAPAAAQERVSKYAPVVPEATGDPHAEGNAYWRRNHMKLMKHDRDETMYNGDRAVQASLAECFECHAVTDEAGTPVTYQDERHFCRTCHDFAAVKVDCFMCHRSTPDGVDEPAMHAAREISEDELRLTEAYVAGLGTLATEGRSE